MSGGGGKGGGKTGSGDKSKTVAQPWAPLVPYLTGQPQGKNPAEPGLFPNAAGLFTNGPSMYTGLNDQQKQGQGLALNYANNFGSMYNPYVQSSMAGLSGAGGNSFTNNALQSSLSGMGANPFANNALQMGLGGMGSNPYTNQALMSQLQGPNVNNNPALDAFANAATRPLQQQLDMQTLPGIRSGATAAGQYGGSRQGISEGVARGLTNQAIGDTRANIYSNAYGQGLNAQSNALGQSLGAQQNTLGQSLNAQNSGVGQSLDAQSRALALYPQLLQSGLIPSSIYKDVGSQNQQDQQGYNMEPYNRLNYYANILTGQSAANQAGKSTVSDASKQGWLDTGLNTIATLSALFG